MFECVYLCAWEREVPEVWDIYNQISAFRHATQRLKSFIRSYLISLPIGNNQLGIHATRCVRFPLGVDVTFSSFLQITSSDLLRWRLWSGLNSIAGGTNKGERTVMLEIYMSSYAHKVKTGCRSIVWIINIFAKKRETRECTSKSCNFAILRKIRRKPEGQTRKLINHIYFTVHVPPCTEAPLISSTYLRPSLDIISRDNANWSETLTRRVGDLQLYSRERALNFISLAISRVRTSIDLARERVSNNRNKNPDITFVTEQTEKRSRRYCKLFRQIWFDEADLRVGSACRNIYHHRRLRS